MTQGRISKRSVDALVCPPGKDRVFLWDDAIAGFGVGAFPTGKKTYYIQFRKDGRTRRSIVGNHGRMTPDEARSSAKKLLGGVEQGADPVATKRAERAVRTFREVAADYMARLHVEGKRASRSLSPHMRHCFASTSCRRSARCGSLISGARTSHACTPAWRTVPALCRSRRLSSLRDLELGGAPRRSLVSRQSG